MSNTDADGASIIKARSTDGSILIEGGGAVDFRSATTAGGFFVPPGPDRAAVIEALVTEGQTTLFFGAGTYELEHPLFQGMSPTDISDVKLIGVGDDRTVFTASYSPAIAQADDPNNALIEFWGRTTAAVSTTIAAGVPAICGSATFTVTNPTGITAGTYLRIQARNAPGNPTDALNMSDGTLIILTELVQVLSIAGPVVTATAPLRQWHTPGATVVSVEPAIGLLLRGIFFDCFNNSIATALTAYLARDIVVELCSWRGFSRAAIDLEQGASYFRISHNVSRGQVNSSTIFDSSMVGEYSWLWCDPEGQRFHPNGIARHQLKFFERATEIYVHDCILQHACGGLSFWGGWYLQFANLDIFDMDPARIRTTDPGFYPGGTGLGVGVDSGEAFTGQFESFALAVTFDGVRVHNCFGTSAFDVAWYMHDTLKFSASGISIENHGPVGGTVIDGVTYNPQGMWINDSEGSVESIYVLGCDFGIQTTGGPTVDIQTYSYDGTAGNGVGVVAFFHNGGGSVRIRELNQIAGGGIFFGAGFVAAPDYTFNIGRLNWIGVGRWSDLYVYQNVSGAAIGIGDVLAIDPASAVGTRKLVASAGPAGNNVSNAIQANNNDYTLATMLPATEATINVAGAGGAGVFIEANATNQGVPNAAAADGTRLGRLMLSKGAGTALAQLGTTN